MTEQFITVGEIVNTQGHRGEVRVLPATDFPERFAVNKKLILFLNNQRSCLTIEKVWQHKQFIILKFAEITDMTAAEKLKGGLLQVTPEELMPLPEDRYYIFQIIGLKVIDKEVGELGQVVQVLQTGANDVYVVKPPQGKEILIPAIKSVVKKIDVSGGRMEVELPEGLI
ncbi:ribosome maturation factor RimM [Desulforamulus hydrothermalis]|uniref:Ribosome maturation factor RimM n=1 Tax=Desulforamulus hydrothermalis Lam5 = DSM 18033 TaxID=1121428 RepID=K8DZG4_9FIRM|nr:ribosome maturation factor RimM [Desulforamulus hydrothermalis]CCO08477.1 Ribosome maturation factor rimM [Desulforamulus hydrothermalis Lam5 = DSM 18033]SHH29221.1 16S rRNA processing protein RimM [Desulforamulus hydrothermalis Lam5 = DSM 18033]